MEKNQQRTFGEGGGRPEVLVRIEEAQRNSGYVSKRFMAEIAQVLGLPLSEVYGVTTFYSFLSTRPLGKNVIRICKSIPCYLKNAEMIIGSVQKVLGISPCETTPDGRFSFELTNCLGACDQAPAMLVNDDVHGHLTPDKIAEILRSYK
jgi:NADH-quinone oxidoreductase E subunit